MKLKISDEWWTVPTEAENGRLIIVTGRADMATVRSSGVFNYRVDVSWHYDGDVGGMPDDNLAELLGAVHDALYDAFKRDPVAVMTGVYTGDDCRDWIFYARSLHIFRNKINEALADFDPLPLEFAAYDDPDWEEYDEMQLVNTHGS